MSDLIKLNPCDIADAHSNTQQEGIYKELIAAAESELDPETGNFKRPFKFEVVQGFFKQSDQSTDESTFDFIKENFGLNLSSWSELISKIKELNENSPSNESYKVLFCARHGQGYHNKAVEIFGLEAWNNHWSHIEGTTLEDGTVMKWGPDPFLTPLGEAQAEELNKAWKIQIGNGCPIPTRFFTSPFTRSATTLIRTWKGIAVCEDHDDEKKLLAGVRSSPIIKEDLRETIGLHLCDKRSSKEEVAKRLGSYGFIFEDGFVNDDIYYKDDWRESLSEQSLRANSFLQDLFKNFENDVFVNCTSHAGEIRALITALSHRRFAIPTAGTIPIVIKATRR